MDEENVAYNMYNCILLSHEKNEILPFAKTWGYIEGIILSEISQMKINKYHIISLTYIILKNKQKRNRFTDTENQVMVARGEGVESS